MEILPDHSYTSGVHSSRPSFTLTLDRSLILWHFGINADDPRYMGRDDRKLQVRCESHHWPLVKLIMELRKVRHFDKTVCFWLTSTTPIQLSLYAGCSSFWSYTEWNGKTGSGGRLLLAGIPEKQKILDTSILEMLGSLEGRIRAAFSKLGRKRLLP